MKIKQLDIEGFRSLRRVSWLPGDLNVIIGPNGTGKSNLSRFMELIAISAQGKLGKYIKSLGGMEPIVWDGSADSIKFSMEIEPETGGIGPELYELELSRLGSGSSYKIEKELLINSHKVRSGIKKQPFKFLERVAKSAVIFDEKESSFVTPEEFISDEESLLSIASGPFINNHFIFDQPPAKMLERLYSLHIKKSYKKVVNGKELFGKLDPDVAYQKCPKLKELLDQMLQLAEPSNQTAR